MVHSDVGFGGGGEQGAAAGDHLPSNLAQGLAGNLEGLLRQRNARVAVGQGRHLRTRLKRR